MSCAAPLRTGLILHDVISAVCDVFELLGLLGVVVGLAGLVVIGGRR